MHLVLKNLDILDVLEWKVNYNTRKSSCVNARGIPPAVVVSTPSVVLTRYPPSWPRGGTLPAYPLAGYPPTWPVGYPTWVPSWQGTPYPDLAGGYPIWVPPSRVPPGRVPPSRVPPSWPGRVPPLPAGPGWVPPPPPVSAPWNSG